MYGYKVMELNVKDIVRNYEDCSEEQTVGVAELAFEAFCSGKEFNLPKNPQELYDVKYILRCIEEKLTEFEAYLLFLRYGFGDGHKKTFAEIGEHVGYSRRWTAELIHKSERKLRYWWHRYPGNK